MKETMNEMLLIKIQNKTESRKQEQYKWNPMNNKIYEQDQISLLPMKLRKKIRKYYGPKIWDFETYGNTDRKQMNNNIQTVTETDTEVHEQAKDDLDRIMEPLDLEMLNEQNFKIAQKTDQELKQIYKALQKHEEQQSITDVTDDIKMAMELNKTSATSAIEIIM